MGTTTAKTTAKSTVGGEGSASKIATSSAFATTRAATTELCHFGNLILQRPNSRQDIANTVPSSSSTNIPPKTATKSPCKSTSKTTSPSKSGSIPNLSQLPQPPLRISYRIIRPTLLQPPSTTNNGLKSQHVEGAGMQQQISEQTQRQITKEVKQQVQSQTNQQLQQQVEQNDMEDKIHLESDKMSTPHTHNAPLVIIHGGPSLPSEYLNPLTHAEALKHRSIILYDQLGCGWSSMPPFRSPSSSSSSSSSSFDGFTHVTTRFRSKSSNGSNISNASNSSKDGGKGKSRTRSSHAANEKSNGPKNELYGIKPMAEHLQQLLHHLKHEFGLTSFHLLGHSLGGAIGYEYLKSQLRDYTDDVAKIHEGKKLCSGDAVDRKDTDISVSENNGMKDGEDAFEGAGAGTRVGHIVGSSAPTAIGHDVGPNFDSPIDSHVGHNVGSANEDDRSTQSGEKIVSDLNQKQMPVCLSFILSNASTNFQLSESERNRLWEDFRKSRDYRLMEQEELQSQFFHTHICRTPTMPFELESAMSRRGVTWPVKGYDAMPPRESGIVAGEFAATDASCHVAAASAKASCTDTTASVSTNTPKIITQFPPVLIIRGEYDFVTEKCTSGWKDIFAPTTEDHSSKVCSFRGESVGAECHQKEDKNKREEISVLEEVVLENCAHYPHFEKLEEYASRIEKFCSMVEPSIGKATKQLSLGT